ncbi:MAG: nuclear transport factor 2 family protein [Finegoldia magna]|uniref:conjugal transfer protein n=1 Tax=Finegoldia magna TaxID=1260 RepID=UPI000B91AA37|nr:conjugal transfer protein [Finegoldia magna]MDU5808446.1 nuclear transport factor 2 family protein [Finegoldia magna]OXZ30262.1 conjugal transfer protein [Finegoldia magna]
MNNRDSIIRMWFRMWLEQKDLGIDNIFDDNIVYTECWGPKYSNKNTVKIWFDEWNTRGKVIKWDILQIIHHEKQSFVQWIFECKMKNGEFSKFEGISLILWNDSNKIKELKEFQCDLNNYNPYENGKTPKLMDDF